MATQRPNLRLLISIFALALAQTHECYCAIRIPALGNAVDLGTLYDLRSAQFKGVVFMGPIPQDAIGSIDTPELKTETKIITKIDEKCNMFSLEAEVSVSVLSGLLEVKGAAEYLNEKADVKETVEVSHYTHIQTEREELKPFYNSLRGLYSLEVLQETNATHMVTGIQWGANILVTFLETKTNSLSVEKIQGLLGIQASLPLVTADAHGRVEVHGDEKKILENLAIKIHADLSLLENGIPESLEQVKDFLAKIPKMMKLSNHGKGKPLFYYLTPISELQSHLQVEISEVTYNEIVSSGTMLTCMRIFQDIIDHERRIEKLEADFRKDFVPHRYNRELRARKAKFQTIVASFKAKVREFIVSSRSNIQQDSMNVTTLGDLENLIDDEIGRLVFPYLKFKEMLYNTFIAEGITYVGKDSILETILYSKHKFRCLLLPNDIGESRNQEFNELFLIFLADRTSEKVVVDCEFSHSTCKELNVTSGIILDFVRARHQVYNHTAEELSIENQNYSVPEVGMELEYSEQVQTRFIRLENDVEQLNAKQANLELEFRAEANVRCLNSGAVEVTLWSEQNRTGTPERVAIHPDVEGICCKNLGVLNKKAQSGEFRISANCVILYDQPDCHGKGRSFHPTISKGYIRNYDSFGFFNKKFSSVRICHL